MSLFNTRPSAAQIGLMTARISSVDPATKIVKGSAPAYATVVVSVDGAVALTVTADGSGAWRGFLPAAPNGGQVVSAAASADTSCVVPGGVGLPASVTTLVAMGDSITAGVAASAPANSWVSKVAALLGATATNAGVNGTVLQNSADSGGSPRADNMRDRYAAQMTGASKKALAIIAGGLNDARYTAAPATMNVANYINDYREMLTGLVNGGYPANRIVIVTPHWMPDAGFSNGTTGFTAQTRSGYETYVKAAKDLAREFGCYLADSFAAMQSAAANGVAIMDADAIHPNDAGHDVIMQAVADARLQVRTACVYDSFSGADGDSLTARAGEIGASWTLAFGYTPGTPAPQIAANRLYNTALSSVYAASGQPGSADYEVIATLYCLSSLAGENVGIFGRGVVTGADSRYWARYLQGTGWQLYKTVGGVSTQLGATSPASPMTAGIARRLMLRMVGGAISLWVDGAQLITVTDADIAAAGFSGVRLATAKTATTGIHVEDLLTRPVTPMAS
ncbi:SGNH/GDSL hydrolase family protein [Hansschlegelia quercus]|uniref:SGNH/GDSL hydrolase family protein n=1 Tax=Hansschlegelia quercus TaxID=2528245 RepID=A0A4Q9GBY3_9HYPH|nr:SGNH/GDSL hydrolase family protein [Hansschlegelia quercus]TBN48680.1 SGNH/GDSL hydrolase family protein [Hansschlegelia quercus]